MSRFHANMPFAVETIFKCMRVVIFVQIITLLLSRQDTKIRCNNWTGYQSCGFHFVFHKIHGTTSAVLSVYREPVQFYSPSQNRHTRTHPDISSPRAWSVRPNRRWWPSRFRADATVRWCTPCREPWSGGTAWWSSNPKCSASHRHLQTPRSWKKGAEISTKKDPA